MKVANSTLVAIVTATAAAAPALNGTAPSAPAPPAPSGLPAGFPSGIPKVPDLSGLFGRDVDGAQPGSPDLDNIRNTEQNAGVGPYGKRDGAGSSPDYSQLLESFGGNKKNGSDTPSFPEDLEKFIESVSSIAQQAQAAQSKGAGNSKRDGSGSSPDYSQLLESFGGNKKNGSDTPSFPEDLEKFIESVSSIAQQAQAAQSKGAGNSKRDVDGAQPGSPDLDNIRNTEQSSGVGPYGKRDGAGSSPSSQEDLEKFMGFMSFIESMTSIAKQAQSKDAGKSKRDLLQLPESLLSGVTGIVENLGQSVGSAGKQSNSKAGKLVQKAKSSNNSVSVDDVRDLVDTIGQSVGSLITKLVDEASKATGDSDDSQKVQQVAAKLGNGLSDSVDKVLSQVGSTLQSS